jgi:hypothetical protein
MSDGPLEHDEMVAILVEIARGSANAAARIAAIKQLMAMGVGEEEDPLEAELRALSADAERREGTHKR